MQEKISLEIGQIPHTTPHLFADLVELLLFFGGYSEVSKSDVEQLLARGDQDPDPEELPDLQPETTAEKQDRVYRFIDDCFLQLEYRVAAFGHCYPFKFEGNVLVRHSELTESRCLYLIMLVCSRLRSFSKKVQQALSAAFEIVSREAMRTLMPKAATVRCFGANSEDRRSYYGTDLRDALVKLGEDLSEIVIEKSVSQESSSGDGGLDIVGYVRFSDPARGSLAMFGQCAAREKEWPKKTFECHPDRLRAFLNFVHDPANVVFIPVCYRQSNGQWVKDSPCFGSVLVDRLRICHLLRDEIGTLDTCEMLSKHLSLT